MMAARAEIRGHRVERGLDVDDRTISASTNCHPAEAHLVRGAVVEHGGKL